MLYLRKSTGSQVVWLGPFVDTSGVAVTSLTIANTDIKLRKWGSTSAASKNSGGATHDANGRYYATLDSTDTSTVGPLRIDCTMSGALTVWHEFHVLDGAVYDWLFGSTAPSTYAGGAVASVTGNVGGNVVGSVGSVTGAVGSVTGNVGGNVTGSVGSVLGNINATGGTVKTLDAAIAALATAHGAGSWATATGFSTFNPATDTVAHVTLVDTCTTNTDMRGTDGAYTGTPPSAAAIATEVVGTDEFVAIKAAVYDTVSVTGDVLTLSNGATQTIGSDGDRTTEGP